jgi:hypothetical protein
MTTIWEKDCLPLPALERGDVSSLDRIDKKEFTHALRTIADYVNGGSLPPAPTFVAPPLSFQVNAFKAVGFLTGALWGTSKNAQTNAKQLLIHIDSLTKEYEDLRQSLNASNQLLVKLVNNRSVMTPDNQKLVEDYAAVYKDHVEILKRLLKDRETEYSQSVKLDFTTIDATTKNQLDTAIVALTTAQADFTKEYSNIVIAGALDPLAASTPSADLQDALKKATEEIDRLNVENQQLKAEVQRLELQLKTSSVTTMVMPSDPSELQLKLQEAIVQAEEAEQKLKQVYQTKFNCPNCKKLILLPKSDEEQQKELVITIDAINTQIEKTMPTMPKLTPLLIDRDLVSFDNWFNNRYPFDSIQGIKAREALLDPLIDIASGNVTGVPASEKIKDSLIALKAKRTMYALKENVPPLTGDLEQLAISLKEQKRLSLEMKKKIEDAKNAAKRAEELAREIEKDAAPMQSSNNSESTDAIGRIRSNFTALEIQAQIAGNEKQSALKAEEALNRARPILQAAEYILDPTKPPAAVPLVAPAPVSTESLRPNIVTFLEQYGKQPDTGILITRFMGTVKQWIQDPLCIMSPVDYAIKQLQLTGDGTLVRNSAFDTALQMITTVRVLFTLVGQPLLQINTCKQETDLEKVTVRLILEFFIPEADNLQQLLRYYEGLVKLGVASDLPKTVMTYERILTFSKALQQPDILLISQICALLRSAGEQGDFNDKFLNLVQSFKTSGSVKEIASRIKGFTRSTTRSTVLKMDTLDDIDVQSLTLLATETGQMQDMAVLLNADQNMMNQIPPNNPAAAQTLSKVKENMRFENVPEMFRKGVTFEQFRDKCYETVVGSQGLVRNATELTSLIKQIEVSTRELITIYGVSSTSDEKTDVLLSAFKYALIALKEALK